MKLKVKKLRVMLQLAGSPFLLCIVYRNLARTMSMYDVVPAADESMHVPAVVIVVIVNSVYVELERERERERVMKVMIRCARQVPVFIP